MGLEFLNVTAQLNIELMESNSIGDGRRREDVYRITNNSSSVVDTHILFIAYGLPSQVTMENASGIASTGDPYLRMFLTDGVLLPGQSVITRLLFRRQFNAPPVSYTPILLSGQGNP
jgi:hypothetical protein